MPIICICGNNLVKSAEAAASKNKNPTLKGWAFKLAQIHVIQEAIRLMRWGVAMRHAECEWDFREGWVGLTIFGSFYYR